MNVKRIPREWRLSSLGEPLEPYRLRNAKGEPKLWAATLTHRTEPAMPLFGAGRTPGLALAAALRKLP